MADYILLLPPSEGKAAGGKRRTNWPDSADDPRANAFAALNGPRRAVMDALQAAPADPAIDPAKLFGVKDAALDAALAVNAALPNGPLLPASQRYTGVMFDYLAYAEMERRVRTAFDKHAVLFSGLWGLLRPRDLIPDYKLKMDASLPGLGPLATYWRPHISAVLNPLAARKVVWDLLPGAHARAWDGKADYAARWQVKFVEEKGGKLRTVTHWSKALKGALVRYICAHRVTDPAALCDFRHPEGYVYRPKQSDLGLRGGTLLFVKGRTG